LIEYGFLLEGFLTTQIEAVFENFGFLDPFGK